MSKKQLTLPCSDDTLKAPVVLSKFTMVPSMAKKIEPVGKFYAKLQDRVVNGIPVQEESTSADEASPVSEKDQENPEEKSGDYSKKKRTKEQIEKEALEMDNLYAYLDL